MQKNKTAPLTATSIYAKRAFSKITLVSAPCIIDYSIIFDFYFVSSKVLTRSSLSNKEPSALTKLLSKSSSSLFRVYLFSDISLISFLRYCSFSSSSYITTSDISYSFNPSKVTE